MIAKLALAVAAPLALAGALGATLAFAQAGAEPTPAPTPGQTAPADPDDGKAGCPDHKNADRSESSQSSASSDQY